MPNDPLIDSSIF